MVTRRKGGIRIWFPWWNVLILIWYIYLSISILTINFCILVGTVLWSISKTVEIGSILLILILPDIINLVTLNVIHQEGYQVHMLFCNQTLCRKPILLARKGFQFQMKTNFLI